MATIKTSPKNDSTDLAAPPSGASVPANPPASGEYHRGRLPPPQPFAAENLELKRRWLKWMVSWITVLVIVQIVMAIAVGTGWMNFEAHPWIGLALVSQNFLMVVALGWFASRCFTRGS